MADITHQKRILIGSSLPGGASCLAPVAHSLSNSGKYTVSCLCGPVAESTFANCQCPASVCHLESDKAAVELLKTLRPECVVTGALGDRATALDYRLQRAAKALAIPRIAVVDSWMHLGSRFMAPDGSDVLHLPDKIIVMDRESAEELVCFGVPESHIVCSGHPFVQYVKELYGYPPSLPIPQENEQPVWGFFSEPLRGYYAGRADSPGYDEFEVFSLIADAAASCPVPPILMVKEHPRDASLQQGYSTYSDSNIQFLDVTDDPFVLVEKSHVILGMSSSMLIWASLLGKTVVAVQPDVRPLYDFNMLTRRGFLRNCESSKCIADSISGGVDQKLLNKLRLELGWEKNTADECVRVIDKLVSSSVKDG